LPRQHLTGAQSSTTSKIFKEILVDLLTGRENPLAPCITKAVTLSIARTNLYRFGLITTTYFGTRAFLALPNPI
jgi:Na+-translocating ferredoxin:NAD+ oxidoreductase RNF subunit RnfB